MIRHFSISVYRLFIVLLNPLWIIEIYLHGHVLLIGILGLWLAIYLFYLKKDWLALPAVIFFFLISVVPLLTYLPFLYKKFWSKIFLVLSGIVLIILFCSASGMISSYYFIFTPDRGIFNGVLISVGLFLSKFINFSGQEIIGIYWFGNPVIVYTRSEFYILLLIVFIVLAVIISQINKLRMTAEYRGINYMQAGYIITAALLLVSPVLNPWQLLWILPFMIYMPNWSWLIFTVLIQLSYLVSMKYPLSVNISTSVWILLIQYIPFYILLITEYLDKRRIKGWF
jgi:hypothetical protein